MCHVIVVVVVDIENNSCYNHDSLLYNQSLIYTSEYY